MENNQSASPLLFIDLNNFAAYPTLAVGYLIRSLRLANHNVELLSPLALGVPAFARDHEENWKDQILRRLYFSSHPLLNRFHDSLRNMHSRWLSRPHPLMIKEVHQAIAKRPAAILISAYLTQYEMCIEIGKVAKVAGIPVLLGGPFFNISNVTNEWLEIEGITAIVGGEVDFTIADIVDTLLNKGDLSQHKGVFLPSGKNSGIVPPLKTLSQLPVPDFTDFPWDKYPHHIIPTMTGRGCSWGACTFCGDVISANGRTFRSRGIESVLRELKQQSKTHHSKDFIFLDIKLNSDLEVWNGLIDHFQEYVPDGRWIGTVHVNHKGENGLSRERLIEAKKAGLTRISFGLESASQSLLDEMKKGTKIEDCSEFILAAHEAGISVRTSMMQGFPGETVDDLRETNAFLKKHSHALDRVRLSLFKPLPDTPFDRMYQKNPDKYVSLKQFKWDYKLARGLYRYHPRREKAYRKEKRELLKIIYAINKKPLTDNAQQFNGMM
ncbi:MAG TPA: B12-binding domain-containing radical SAM protein [Thiotrichaceae bacterium]|nr:B12-binding domain-containing radical SAM protein [Thiotrichaceae bacterium]